MIFGETGVGKSSVINLIANQDLAHISNDAVGCTFRSERHPIMLGDISCAIWDTVGLDEGSEGTVPAKEAENNLRDLIQVLAQSGGIHLVIYCIRGTRLTKALKRNYELFYVTACRRKVPVALVVTGLEHQQKEMETWWIENEEELRRNGMWFDAHACVTTLNVADQDIQQRRSSSRTMLCELVVKYSELPGWKTDSSILSLILPIFHSAYRGTSSARRSGCAATVRKVIVYGSSPRFFPGTAASREKTTATIGGRQYELRRVDKHTLNTIKPEAYVGMGLLIFYSSALVENLISPPDVEELKKFYDVAGGHSCPVIVVLQGCEDEQVARDCQVEVASRYSDIQAHFISTPGVNDVGGKLDEMIEMLCLEQVHVKAPGSSKK